MRTGDCHDNDLRAVMRRAGEQSGVGGIFAGGLACARRVFVLITKDGEALAAFDTHLKAEDALKLIAKAGGVECVIVELPLK
jgi:hypothetical protein